MEGALGSVDKKEPGKLEYIKMPELVIGLVGPVGLQWGPVIDVLQEEFSRVDYSVEHIRLSHLLEEIFGTKEKQKEGAYQRLDRLMTQGDTLREVVEHPNAVGLLAIAAIQRAREDVNCYRAERVNDERNAGSDVQPVSTDVRLDINTPKLRPLTSRDNALLDLEIDPRDFGSVPLTGCAYILRSLKLPAEVQLLRRIYGQFFILIAAYSKHDARTAALAEQIAASLKDSDSTRHRADAERLIARDEKDRESTSGEKFGQNVRNTFPLADLFVDADERGNLKESIGRFVDSLFSYQFHTPTRDEFGIFHAMAASRRSADLSRQVGAAVTTLEGDVVSVGCNEVPKAGGGLYWAGDPGDRRDYHLGKDVRHEITDIMLREAIQKLKETAVSPEILAEIFHKLEESDDLKEAITKFKGEPELLTSVITEIFARLEQGHKNALRGARIKGLLEFGRTVHAEMAALSDAALRGISVKNGIMYVTTLPCHMCARHIVAAGIKRVVYIEPYPKSMVRKLYPDSICIDGGCDEQSVRFEPFFGFAPRIYLRFFDIPDEPMREYKEGDQEGKVIPWNTETMKCRIKRYVTSYLFIEIRALNYIGTQFDIKKEDIMECRHNKNWHGLEKKEALHTDKRITEWLRDRKTKIEEDLEKTVPRWMKMAILAHRYI